jgi:acetyl-CoA carboxylase carboxyl transferase subunit alpha
MPRTAKNLHALGVIDEIIPEPPGGAHTDHQGAARIIDEFLARQIDEISRLGPEDLVEHRHEKFRKMGAYLEPVD